MAPARISISCRTEADFQFDIRTGFLAEANISNSSAGPLRMLLTPTIISSRDARDHSSPVC